MRRKRIRPYIPRKRLFSECFRRIIIRVGNKTDCKDCIPIAEQFFVRFFALMFFAKCGKFFVYEFRIFKISFGKNCVRRAFFVHIIIVGNVFYLDNCSYTCQKLKRKEQILAHTNVLVKAQRISM